MDPETPGPGQWRYAPARDLGERLPQRLRRFPREPDLAVYLVRSVAALAIRAWLRLWHRLEISGRENLPSTGSFALVANHASHLDALVLLAALPLRRIHRAFPAAAADHFFVDFPRVAFSAVVINALPFGRDTHVRESLEICRRLLDAPGHVLILFPEGTRSTTGALGAFRPGIGHLLAGRETPAVPCRIQGAFEAWPKGARLPRPRKLKVAIGAPRSYRALEPGKASAVEVAEDLRTAILALESPRATAGAGAT